MIDPTGNTEKMLFTTVRIAAHTDGTGSRIGTAFCFAYQNGPNEFLPLIVTNWHLVDGARSVSFLVHEDKDGKPSDISHNLELDASRHPWIRHPNHAIDLCAMLFKPLMDFAVSEGWKAHSSYLLNEFIWTDEKLATLQTVENVLMIGYPNGLWDDVNILPLIRRGITSSHPAIDFKGKPETVIDMACFEGSSGSPVLIYDHGWIVDKHGNVTQGVCAVFLGVLSAGASGAVDAKVVAGLPPPEPRPVYQTEFMLHLGYVIKAKEVLRLGEHLWTVFSNAARFARSLNWPIGGGSAD